MMGKYTKKHRWGVLLTFVLAVITQLVQAQSGSTGSTFVHTGGEMGIFGQHDFQNGSGTINAGIIGSERLPAIGVYGFVNSAGSWINANDLAFVDGYVRTYNIDAFTFPIGDNDKYRPAAVSASSSAAPTTAAYYGVDPGLATTSDLKGGNYGILPGGGTAFPTTSKDAGVGTVDNVEYWDIDGTTSARITLTWDAATPISAMVGADLSKLKIVGWDGTKWVVIPSTVDAGSLVLNTSASAFKGPAGTVSAGSITTDASVVPGSFVVYTLAGISCDLIATALPTAVTSCVSPNTGAITISYTGSDTYQYSLNGGGLQSLGASPATISNLAAGSYTLVVQGGGTPTCSQTLVTTLNAPVTPIINAISNSPLCSGSTLSLNATAGFTSYSWSGPNGFASNLQNPTIPTTTTATSGVYTVQVVNVAGCTGSSSTTVTIADQPSLTVTAGAGLTVCSGQSTTLSVGGSNGAVVTWTNNLGQSGSGMTINFAGVLNNSAQIQTITYEIVANAGACSDRETVTLTVKPAPFLLVNPQQAVICALEQTSITGTTTPATATINWTRTLPTPASGSGTGSVTVSEPLSAGNYNYTFTATEGGCTSSPVTVPLTVNN